MASVPLMSLEYVLLVPDFIILSRTHKTNINSCELFSGKKHVRSNLYMYHLWFFAMHKIFCFDIDKCLNLPPLPPPYQRQGTWAPPPPKPRSNPPPSLDPSPKCWVSLEPVGQGPGQNRAHAKEVVDIGDLTIRVGFLNSYVIIDYISLFL